LLALDNSNQLSKSLKRSARMSVPAKVDKKATKKRKTEDDMDDRKKKKKAEDEVEEEEEPETWTADVMAKTAWLMRVPNHLGTRVSLPCDFT
jgi:hypothetical protein